MRDRYYLSWSSESNPMACFFLVPLTRRVVNASSRLKILRFETASPLFRGLSSVTRASLLLLLLLLSRRAFSSFLFSFFFLLFCSFHPPILAEINGTPLRFRFRSVPPTYSR